MVPVVSGMEAFGKNKFMLRINQIIFHIQIHISFRCNVWCRLPVITPCQHLLCLDCVALDSEKCTLPGCGNHYEMESPKTREKKPENPNPKWPVPKDLIELQPSYKQVYTCAILSIFIYFACT